MAGPTKKIQNRGEPVKRAKPCIKHNAYNTTYKLCVDQKNLYAFWRIVGWAKTNIIVITINNKIPVKPALKKQ